VARWVSPQQAADYLGIHVVTMRRRIRSGDVPATRLGPRLLRVDLDELDRLGEQQESA
jgi:excisionase family DNA binding protein